MGGATKRAPIKRRAKWSRRDIEHVHADVMRKGYQVGLKGQGRFPGLFVISLHFVTLRGEARARINRLEIKLDRAVAEVRRAL